MKYGKLIRDKIPEIIKASRANYETHVAGNDEYQRKLREKLREEVEEFLSEPCIEELADILEVVNALAEFEFDGIKNLEEVRKRKFERRGGFEEKLILDEADDR